MKILLVVCVVIIPYSLGMPNNANLTEQINQMKTIMLEVIREKCYQNSAEKYEHFTEILANFTFCVIATSQESPIFVTPLKTFKDNIQSCANDIIEELENCLPKEINEWPQLNLEIFFSISDFFYENKEQLFSPQIRSFIQTCSEISQKPEIQIEYMKCMNLFDPTNLDWKMSCRQLFQWEKCVMTQLNHHCPGDEIIERLKVDFLEALNIACVEYEQTDNPVDSMFTLLAPYAQPNLNPDLM